jgi:hypothetical protein
LLQPEFKRKFPIQALFPDHLQQIHKQPYDLFSAVPERMEKPSGIVQISSDIGTAFRKAFKPFLFRKAEKIFSEVIVSGKFLQSGMRTFLLHDSVPAVFSVLPAQFLHKWRTVQNTVNFLPVNIQFPGNLPRFQPVVMTD